MGARCPKQNPIVIIVLSEVLKETFAPGTEVVIEGTRLKIMTSRWWRASIFQNQVDNAS